MPPDTSSSLIPWLSDPNALFLALFLAVALLAGAYYALKRPTTTQRPRERPEGLGYCAQCIHRDGDQCWNPDSPVFQQPCRPVCTGALQCDVREFRGDNH